jgi:hypothetical protein
MVFCGSDSDWQATTTIAASAPSHRLPVWCFDRRISVGTLHGGVVGDWFHSGVCFTGCVVSAGRGRALRPAPHNGLDQLEAELPNRAK